MVPNNTACIFGHFSRMISSMKKLSVIIPLNNEERSFPELWQRLSTVFQSLASWDPEVLFIDDGSTDRTLALIKEAAVHDPRVRAISFRKNFKTTAALAAGLEYSRGEVIILMDGDLQHQPEDIPRFLAKIEEGYDIVSSWRHKRQDNLFTRRIPSWIANRLMVRISGVKIRDFGGLFKAYRRSVLEGLELYPDMHRFIPAIVSWSGNYKICELPIDNPPRKYGKSHFGLGRTFRVLFDLIAVKYFTAYIARPLHFFGTIGLTFIGLGMIGGLFLLIKKVFFHIAILEMHGPLFIVSVFGILIGFQCVMFGIISEVLTRIYHRTADRKIYSVKETINL